MITTYHRPQTLDEALSLLAQPNTLPLGGGTLLSHGASFNDDKAVEVVDLQQLGLDTITKVGNNLELGATLTLQGLLESEHCSPALKTSLKLEAPLNIRNAATIAGTLVACDGRSTFATMLLAMDAKIEQASFDNSKVEYRISNVGEFLPLRSTKLITKITLPLNVKVAFEYVARTPSDKPIVCVAVAGWGSGRTRIALGGYGKSSMLAMDGTEAEGADTAAKNVFYEATDEWASAEYRMDVAATLTQRCLEGLKQA